MHVNQTLTAIALGLGPRRDRRCLTRERPGSSADVQALRGRDRAAEQDHPGAHGPRRVQHQRPGLRLRPVPDDRHAAGPGAAAYRGARGGAARRESGGERLAARPRRATCRPCAARRPCRSSFWSWSCSRRTSESSSTGRRRSSTCPSSSSTRAVKWCALLERRGGLARASRRASGRHTRTRKAPPDPSAVSMSPASRIFYRDVVVMDRVERVLAAVASPRQPTDFAGASLSFLQQLVTLDLLRRRDELRMRRRVRRGLLRDLLAGDGDADELRIRLQEQGFDEESVLRIAIVEPQPHAASDPGDAAARGLRSGSAARCFARSTPCSSRRRMPFLSSAVGLADRGPLQRCPTPRRRLRGPCSPTCRRRRQGGPPAKSSSVLRSAGRGGQRPEEPSAGQGRLHGGAPRTVVGRRGVFDELSGHFRLLDGLDEKALTTSSSARSRRFSTTTRVTAPACTRRSTRCSSTTWRSRRPPTRCTSTATRCRSGWRTWSSCSASI